MAYITIVGINHYFGSEIFRVNQHLVLEKDPDNTHDEEAIKVMTEAGVTVGYVGNSIYSVAKGTRSAGRIYDSFEDKSYIRVCFIVGDAVIAKIEEDFVNAKDEISF